MRIEGIDAGGSRSACCLGCGGMHVLRLEMDAA